LVGCVELKGGMINNLKRIKRNKLQLNLRYWLPERSEENHEKHQGGLAWDQTLNLGLLNNYEE
jgi:hypothetical protein